MNLRSLMPHELESYLYATGQDNTLAISAVELDHVIDEYDSELDSLRNELDQALINIDDLNYELQEAQG